MKKEVRKSFEKDFKKLSKVVRDKVILILISINRADKISEIKNIAKLKGSKNYFRIRCDDHRIGLRLEEDTLIIDRVLHRSKIYNFYPPKK